VKPFDLSARRHHGADAAVAEAEHHLDHGRFRRLEMAGGGGLAQHQRDLLLGHRRRLTRAHRNEPQDQVARRTEEAFRRPARPGHHLQKPGQPCGEIFGPAERQPLRHQLAEDQREIGDEDHDRGKADRFRIIGGPAWERLEVLRQRVGERGAAEGAGDDADDGDADLHSGEKASGIALQLERHPGAVAPELGGMLEPRLARRHHGHLRHGEEAVQQDQQEYDGDLQPQHGESARLASSGPTIRATREYCAADTSRHGYDPVGYVEPARSIRVGFAFRPARRKILTLPTTAEASLASVATIELISGGGELSALVRSKDWAQTPLGPIETWPQSLRTVVQIMLGSRYAMWMGWGADLIFFYNDAYRPTLGIKHSWALGASARQVWREIWPDIGPRIDLVLQHGEATWDEGLLLFLERHGFPEETYHTFSYSPLRDDRGAVGGMLCVVTEETDRVIGERRLRVLRELAAGIATTRKPDELFDAIRTSLGAHRHDMPFTLTYAFEADGRYARLVSSSGVGKGDPIAAPMIDSSDTAAPWPIGALRATLTPTLIEDLANFPALPSGAWDIPPRQAIAFPLAQQGQTSPAGVFIAGINPYRPLD